MSTAQLLPNVYQTWQNSNGVVLAGGQLYSYVAGTTTPQATYTDETAATPNANPTILSASGQASVWLRTDLSYKLKLLDASNNLIWTADNVNIVNPASIDKTKIAANIAGVALAQNNSTQALDVQIDNSTIVVNGSNQLVVNTITASEIGTSSKLEVVTRCLRDLTSPAIYDQVPQYEWSTPTLITQPGTIPGGAATCCRWSSSGEFLAVGSTTTPYVLFYQMLNGVLTKLADTETLPGGAVNDLAWSPRGDFIATGGQYTAAPSLAIYNRTGNSWSRMADVSAQSISQLVWSKNSDFLISSQVRGGLIDPLIIYQWNVSYLGGSAPSYTDISMTANLSNMTGPLAFSYDSSLFLAIDKTTSLIDANVLSATAWSSITPPTVTSYAGDITAMAFSPDRNFLAVSVNVTPYILIFTVSSGNVFSQLSNPANLPAGAANCVAWSANSEYLAVGHATTPFMTIYQVTNPTTTPTFTKVTSPVTAPAAAVVGIDFSPTKQYLAVASATTPYIQVYKTASTLPANALLWTREAPLV